MQTSCHSLWIQHSKQDKDRPLLENWSHANQERRGSSVEGGSGIVLMVVDAC